VEFVARCIRCGASEVSDIHADLTFLGSVVGRKIICWRCGATLHVEEPQSIKCSCCEFGEAVFYYDERDGVVIYCPKCGRRECSGLNFREHWKTVECVQCGNPEAEEFFDGFGVDITCNRCGRFEETQVVEVSRKSAADVYEEWDLAGWKHEVHFGAGCLRYQDSPGTCGFKYLHTEEEVAEAEKETRARLSRGEYLAQGTYLTRWNVTRRQVELVCGEFKIDLGMHEGCTDEQG
jgi:transcription elongation factor Elf1